MKNFYKSIQAILTRNGKVCGATALMAAATLSATALPQDIVEAQMTETETQQEDQRTPTERASDSYKNYRTIQMDGASDEEVYNAVYAVWTDATDAISLEGLSEEETDQLRGILLDINTTLARAAINYSSAGDRDNMTRFAKAYVDTQLMPQMATAEFKRDPELYAALVYVAASGSFNTGDIDNAIKYFEAYLDTDHRQYRENVAQFYGQSLIQTKQQQRGRDAIVAVSNEFPANLPLVTIAMQLCLDTDRRDLAGPLVERALTLKPNDERFLNLHANVLEDNREYRSALDIYMQLDEMRPNSLSINEAIARCYYNLGTSHYNESIQAATDKDIARSRRQSNAYFSNAAEKFEELSQNAPNNAAYIRAMASAYAVLGNKSKVDAANLQLTALGAPTVAMNDLPAIMGDSASSTAGKRQVKKIPSYQEYAQQFVTDEISKWAKRGEFEKVDDYTKRIAPENIRKEQKRLSAITEEKYLKEFGGHLIISQLKLRPYDVENETYAIDSDYGPVYIKVPLKNKEAELFKNTWEKVQIKNAKFFIQNDNLAVSTITFRTPNGKEYTYNANNSLAYEPPVVEVDLDKLIAQGKSQKSNAAAQSNTGRKSLKITAESDVDKNIPVNKRSNNAVAVVIANENYEKVSNVTSAEHDGDIFARYCRETLGIPDNQVLLFQDATYGNTLSAIGRLKNMVQALGPDTDVIFYYAGHGVPDERSKEAYLLPVDADPLVMATAYPLSTLYDELGKLPAGNVMVFMDACFSGSNRGDGMLSDARGVVLKPKAAAPQGNMFVLSAADGNETALPWTEKNHGLFTYYLLKKLQESKGNASLKEIADYVSSEVSKTSSTTLGKPQHPKMTSNGAISNQLDKKTLRK